MILKCIILCGDFVATILNKKVEYERSQPMFRVQAIKVDN